MPSLRSDLDGSRRRGGEDIKQDPRKNLKSRKSLAPGHSLTKLAFSKSSPTRFQTAFDEFWQNWFARPGSMEVMLLHHTAGAGSRRQSIAGAGLLQKRVNKKTSGR